MRGIAFAVQRFQDLRGAVQEGLGMRQPGVLGLQRIPFVRAQRQLVQFLNLPLDAIALRRQAGGVFLCGFQLPRPRAPLLPGLADGLAQIAMAAVSVQQVALGIGAHQALMGMLAVDVDQAVAQFAQLGDGGGRAVDIGAAAALRIDDAAQRQFVVGVDLAFGQPGVQRLGRVEDGGDVGAGRAFTQHAGVAAVRSMSGR
ncbi:hypothetical protein G6F62_013424 [Rhizopus arrhizus]|nr:hypothetical protein G6F62_013424 [Rhizopus arrhizus]